MPRRNTRSASKLYAAYRKIRYLSRRGSLFSFPGVYVPGELKPEPHLFRIITINSLFLYLVAYLFLYATSLMITGFTAVMYNIPVVIYYNDIDFLIRGIDWTPDSVSGVFSSSPAAMLLIAVFLLIIYKSVETERGIMRLLALWMIYHALTRLFGEILVGALMDKGFGFVILYLFVTDTGKVVLTILGLVVMIMIGTWMTRQSLYTANIWFNDLRKSYRNKFIISQFFLPYLIGNIVIFLFKIPETSLFDISLNAAMILFLVPLPIRSASYKDFYFDLEPRKVALIPLLPVITVVMILVFRIVFGFGMRLGQPGATF